MMNLHKSNAKEYKYEDHSMEAGACKLQGHISRLENNIIEGNEVISVLEEIKESNGMLTHYSALQNYWSKNQLKAKLLPV